MDRWARLPFDPLESGQSQNGNPLEINPEIVACFSSLKNDSQLTSFHQQSTTNSPSKDHVLHPLFCQNPKQNQRNSSRKKIPSELACTVMRKAWKTTTNQADNQTEMRMEVTNPKQRFVQPEAGLRSNSITLWGIALVVALVHLLTNGRYGFHRDEFQFLSDARHLD
ncbi:hypothetical protein RBB79_01995 [Tunturiibacter empetritectus]|uniref:Uncharacterized protein n=1 Tax=Tunturiibacter lichenicola TaxID=2051959 RepID=A0A852VA22_9BACT|nr:hypothetical protein [Edaphobacter lichenicola]NYF88267.1 hypothetical protein [Edaphobacter lichenicola]